MTGYKQTLHFCNILQLLAAVLCVCLYALFVTGAILL